ncbi:hypothetical protein [Parasitella parasitica]|uniref:Cap-specific mRNA (nucleoside-2'-O-)-methyltransferase 1 n=1 Tax=Parasitella parasitica TaxID=35722 RepID=A0A0B7MNF0_9FUNG|nr:hypothetical protein [Parasitella parasitica]
MCDLYSDNDPEYRSTQVRSGIPPPSVRDRHHRGNDLSRLNPAMQRSQHSHQHQRHSPYEQTRDSRRYQNHHQEHDSQRYQQHRYPGPQQHYPEQKQHHEQQQRYASHPQHHEPQQQPPAPKPKPLELRTSTDFLKCEKRLSLADLVDTIECSACTAEPDYDFLSSKALVDKVNQLRENIRNIPYELRTEARSKSNPFERVGNAIFMNRAATKLAALDATFGLAATNNGQQEFTFADICGGPGGFSEYLLWRVHSWGASAHGYGITLKGSDEVKWHTDKFRADIPRHSLTQIDGADGTGDIYKPDNIRQFEATVLKETRAKGVDLAVADGGFDFSGNEAQQELSAQRLLLCEVVTMLTCLKQGGHFVCKFFDILSESTAGLVWLLYQLFDEICITKPLSSRPANAERYIVCKGLIHERPLQLVEVLIKAIGANTTAIRVVSRQSLEKDEDFIDYVKMRNIRFAMKQTEALEQMGQFIKNPQLAPLYDQEQVKRHCLNEWRLPLHDAQHYF